MNLTAIHCEWLYRHLRRHENQPQLRKRSQLGLPHFWAGFDTAGAQGLTGQGPELTQYARRVRTPAIELFTRATRQHDGLLLYPLEWVSHAWPQIRGVYADLQGVPKRQIIRARRLQRALRGHVGAVEYDLSSSLYGHSSLPGEL